MKSLFFTAAFLFSISSFAGIELVAKNAVVINAPFNFTDAEGNNQTVEAPWFLLDMTVTNNTGMTITLTQFGISTGKSRAGLALAPGESFTVQVYVENMALPNDDHGIVEVYGMFGTGTTEVLLASTTISIAQ